MPLLKGVNLNHPRAGTTIAIESIRKKKAIANIQQILGRSPHDLCLFTLGVNTSYRANVLLLLRVSDVLM